MSEGARSGWGRFGLGKEMLVLPILALVSVAVAFALWSLPGVALVNGFGVDPSWAVYLTFVPMYVVAAFGAMFFLAAMVDMASRRSEGEEPTLREGVVGAWSLKGKLVAGAVGAAVVGFVLRLLVQETMDMGGPFGALVELAWFVGVVVAVPVLLHRQGG